MSGSEAVSRRRFLQRGAVVGGALVWAVPGVTLMSTGRAFAATGSGRPSPPPGTTDPGQTGTPIATTPGTGLGTTVLGETFSKRPATVSSTGSDTSTTSPAAATLPFTGPDLPVRGALETAGGLLAVGALLRHIARDRPAVVDDD